MEDIEIISLYQSRDENAIRQTEQKYSRYLFIITYNILHNNEDSDECVNDTYLKAWETIPPHLPNALSYYLGKIARELSIDRLRKKTSRKRGGTEYELSLDELCECVSSEESPENAAEMSLLVGLIEDYLRKCKDDTRAIFICRYYFCDSIKAIANYFGMSESKVKGILFRTRKGLKEHLIKEGFAI